MDKLVRFEVADNVGTITLNRPEKLNALSDAMHQDLDDAFVAAFRTDEARVIILTGAGRAFCAGADMERLDRLAAGRGSSFDLPRPGIVTTAFEGLDAPSELLGTYTFPLAILKPVIAVVNGPCAGIGLMLATGCDTRFAGVARSSSPLSSSVSAGVRFRAPERSGLNGHEHRSAGSARQMAARAGFERRS